MRGSKRAHVAFMIVVGSAALIPTAGSAAVAPPVGVVFGGETTQGEVITIEVDSARTKVLKLQFSWTAECLPGPAATPTTAMTTGWTEYRGPFRISATGAWKKSLVVNSTEGPVQQAFTYAFLGRRVGGTMKGTLNATLTETDPTGQVIRTCVAPATKFKANEGHVFGGLTPGTRDPVIAIMNRARTKVLRLRWDWRGTCTPGPAAKSDTSLEVTWRDFLTGFDVNKAGYFGFTGTLGPETVPELGLSRSYTYKVVARRSGQSIKGSVTSSFVELDTASGGVIRTCASTGPVKFRVKD